MDLTRCCCATLRYSNLSYRNVERKQRIFCSASENNSRIYMSFSGIHPARAAAPAPPVARLHAPPGGRCPVAQIRRAGVEPRRGQTQARGLPRRPPVNAPPTRQEESDGPLPRRHAGRPAHRRLVRPALRPPGERSRRRRPRSLDRRRALQQAPAAQGRLRRTHRHHERGEDEALCQLAALGRQGRAAAHRRQLRALHRRTGGRAFQVRKSAAIDCPTLSAAASISRSPRWA